MRALCPSQRDTYPPSAGKQLMLMETLLISERCHGLRRKRERYLKSKAVNNQLLLSNACNRALGQSERELLRQKDVSEMQVSDWRLTFECLVSQGK